ncbi:MAG: DNA-protecting protein DprA [Atopobiaceae bacterium]|nr:DNA-protecting protein DprA [Atopobiaceae bacterium]
MSAERWELEREDELFPESLREETTRHIKKLYGVGDPSVLNAASLSVIGARRATPYGIAIAEMAGRIAAECEVSVVSGGAMGCDHAASRAALDAGGTTVIVSGCGADDVYPRSSADIFHDAVECGGAVISLSPWGAPPTRSSFPRRNVVIAALSPALLVAEAGERSGTMSTANAALDMDRTIYAVPGSIFSPNSTGTNRLVTEGALPICSEVDLEMRISMDYGVMRIVMEGANAEMGEVASALAASPWRPDELAARLGQSVLTLLQTLADYESRGIVEHLPDGRYSLTSAAYQQYRTTPRLRGKGSEGEEVA